MTSQVDICLWQYMVQQYEAGEEERLLGQGCMKHGLTKGHMTCCSPLEIQRHQELSLMVECHISPMWLFAHFLCTDNWFMCRNRAELGDSKCAQPGEMDYVSTMHPCCHQVGTRIIHNLIHLCMIQCHTVVGS